MRALEWRHQGRVSVGCAVVLSVLVLLILFAVCYSPDKCQLTKHAHREWSRRFRAVGLDGVPERARYWGAVWVDGDQGHWQFRATVPAMREWLSKSPGLRAANVARKPNKEAYLFYVPAARTACLVMVFFAPRSEPSMVADGEAAAMVDTIHLGTKGDSPSGRARAVQDALEELAYRLHRREMWERE